MTGWTDWESEDSIRVGTGWGDEPRVVTFPGARVVRRGEIWRDASSLHLKLDGGVLADLIDGLPALWRVGYGRKNDWVDRKALHGLLRLRPRSARCFACGGYLSAKHGPDWGSYVDPAHRLFSDPMRVVDGLHPCHHECFHRRLEERDRVHSAVKPLRAIERQTKALAKIAEVMDVPMPLDQAAKLLPWRPHKSALLRMVLKGRLQSTTVDGERRLRGRDLLPLVQNWVETGRAPWRNSRKARAARAKEVTA
jgi:hypothetical protein